MIGSRFFSRISRSGITSRLLSASSRPEAFGNLSSGFRSLTESTPCFPIKVPCQSNQVFGQLGLANTSFQRFGFSSSASPQPTEKEGNQSVEHETCLEEGTGAESSKTSSSSTGSDNVPDAGHFSESKDSKTHSDKRRRRRGTKRTAFSDSDTEAELSMEDLVKLVAEKEELLKLKHKEIEKMQDKVLRSYAEMENVIDRTRREAENSKKYAIQSFAKNLLDVADNLGRASSVVKESFSKIDASKDSVGAVPLLKTLLEGVEMTEKQLAEVFRKFGVEKFDPMNENFDPHRHHAVFQIPDASKPPGSVAAVVKVGYMLYDRVLRPAEVGVTEGLNNDADQNSTK
ncbi:grpE protein homolog 2, mitochondrial-like isoform X1 [Typha latifolia]|uniref:grpE protein homolog 2, mitochondrial-like isoform X1 n=1 Tax=Typha latifolia TaxID=4733 RepID=UPI003C2C5EE2